MTKERPILFSGAMVQALLAGTKTQTRRVGKCQIDSATELGVDYIGHATKGQQAIATYRAFPEGGSARWGLCACPYGVPGDRLWVKETFLPKASGPIYRADFDSMEAAGLGGLYGGWKPSIFMPRKLSRISLEIVKVRVERLQVISNEDAMAEGIERVPRAYGSGWKDYRGKPGAWLAEPKISYASLWNSINLPPSPVYERDAAGKKVIVRYESFPWSLADFLAAYPKSEKRHRGKPMVITPNPWVWVVEFKVIV